MIQKYILFSEEVEDFVLEIKTDGNASFADLRQLVCAACGYEETRDMRFLVCDEDWHVRQKIHATEPDNVRSDEDVYLMRNTVLRDFMEEEGQHLAFVFDSVEKRHFLLDLSEISYGKSQPKPAVSRRHGEAPPQFLKADEAPVTPNLVQPAVETGEEFYGSEGFEDEDIDMEAFDIREE